MLVLGGVRTSDSPSGLCNDSLRTTRPREFPNLTVWAPILSEAHCALSLQARQLRHPAGTWTFFVPSFSGRIPQPRATAARVQRWNKSLRMVRQILSTRARASLPTQTHAWLAPCRVFITEQTEGFSRAVGPFVDVDHVPSTSRLFQALGV